MDTNTLRKLAKSAGIKLDETEMHTMANSISRIDGFINELKEVHDTDVEPLINVSSHLMKLREDIAKPVYGNESLKTNAPDFKYGYISVPRILDGD